MQEFADQMVEKLVQKKEDIIREAICNEIGTDWNIKKLCESKRLTFVETRHTGDQFVLLDGKTIAIFKEPIYNPYVSGGINYAENVLRYKICNTPEMIND